MRYILGIDPANKESGYVLVDGVSLRPLESGKVGNERLLDRIAGIAYKTTYQEDGTLDVVIEMVESFGMPVGREVFDTCVWIGRFTQASLDIWSNDKITVHYVTRKEEKLALCHSMKANDATIKQALVDRFAPDVPNYGKGTKKEKGWFYGFKADIWSAYAVAVTYFEKGAEQ